MSKNLNKIKSKRALINQIDRELLILLKKRFRVLKDIKKIKTDLKLPAYDPRREEIMLKKANKILKNNKNKSHIIEVYKAILAQFLTYMSKSCL